MARAAGPARSAGESGQRANLALLVKGDGADRRRRHDNSLIMPAFSSSLKAHPTAARGIDEARGINDCPGHLDWEQFLIPTPTAKDFTKRLDQTAEDTEALLGKLLLAALLA